MTVLGGRDAAPQVHEERLLRPQHLDGPRWQASQALAPVRGGAQAGGEQRSDQRGSGRKVRSRQFADRLFHRFESDTGINDTLCPSFERLPFVSRDIHVGSLCAKAGGGGFE